MPEHISELLMPEFPKRCTSATSGRGGSNLGCSSSRNAPLFLKKKGIGVVICHSASHILYSNALDSGFFILEIGDAIEKIHMGGSIQVDINTGRIDNLTTGETIQAKPLLDFIMETLEAGGINPCIAKHKTDSKLFKRG